jgi:hypothetical protein
MKKKVAKARITPEMLDRLNNGEIVIVNIPPDVCQLWLSLHDDKKDMFDEIFDGMFRNFFKKFTSRTLK